MKFVKWLKYTNMYFSTASKNREDMDRSRKHSSNIWEEKGKKKVDYEIRLEYSRYHFVFQDCSRVCILKAMFGNLKITGDLLAFQRKIKLRLKKHIS